MDYNSAIVNNSEDNFYDPFPEKEYLPSGIAETVGAGLGFAYGGSEGAAIGGALGEPVWDALAGISEGINDGLNNLIGADIFPIFGNLGATYSDGTPIGGTTPPPPLAQPPNLQPMQPMVSGFSCPNQPMIPETYSCPTPIPSETSCPIQPTPQPVTYSCPTPMPSETSCPIQPMPTQPVTYSCPIQPMPTQPVTPSIPIACSEERCYYVKYCE